MAHVLAQQLRDAVLQYAIQGKLTEQLPEDGEAKNLVCEINNDATVDGRKVKKKEMIGIDYDNLPFDIPSNWTWVKLGDICIVARGGSPRPIKAYITNKQDGINWIKIGDTQKNGKYIDKTNEKIIPEGIKKSRLVHPGDFLLTNSMSFGRPYITRIKGCIHDGWLVISQKKTIFNSDYLYWLLSSNYTYNQFCDKVSGAVVKNLNSDKVANSMFPLPPLAEQTRIVARVDELMAMIDEYEKLENQLVELKRDFPGDMKDAILLAAMQGKLTDRRGDDTNNSLKYKNIAICDDEISVPDNWIITKLKNIATHQNGKAFKPADWTPTGLKIIRIQNLTETDAPANYCDKTIVEDKYLLSGNDVLVSWSCTIDAFRYKGEPAALNQHIFKAIFDKVVVDEQFYIYAIKSLLSTINKQRHGSTMTHITKTDYEELLFPLPPIEEQKRIVEKLDQLLPLCESLEN